MESLIDIRNLRVAVSTGNGAETEIVKSISFAVKRGEVMGLIGESGSGKTTIALAVMGYTRYGCRISGGSIRIGGTEVTKLDAKALAALRGRRVAYIAQSAAAAFNPSRMIMAQVIESALIHGTASKAEAMAKAVGLFRALAIPNPETIGRRYPHQVSGGQLQRLMAAMALITDPEVVIFDEPTTALDVTTQIEVLKAFKNAIRERNTTGIYVTHDLPVIAQIADRIIVLRDGEVQEKGRAHSPPVYSHAWRRATRVQEVNSGYPADENVAPSLPDRADGYSATTAAARPATNSSSVGGPQMTWKYVIATPHCAMPHRGSFAATSWKTSAACAYAKECNIARPRSNAGFTPAVQDVGKWTPPNFSAPACAPSCSCASANSGASASATATT